MMVVGRVSVIVVMIVAVAVVVTVLRMVGGSADAADVVVVALLRRAGVVLVADDLRAVLAELAIHARLAVDDLADAVGEAVEDEIVVAQIRGLQDLDRRMRGGDAVGGG